MKLIYRAIAISFVVWLARTLTVTARQKADSRERNRLIDQMSADSFPSSDPPSSWAGVPD
jgi:hypothetical protein